MSYSLNIEEGIYMQSQVHIYRRVASSLQKSVYPVCSLTRVAISCSVLHLPISNSEVYIWTAAWQNQQNDLCAQRRLREGESSLSVWRNIGPFTTYWAHSVDSDQTGWMHFSTVEVIVGYNEPLKQSEAYNHCKVCGRLWKWVFRLCYFILYYWMGFEIWLYKILTIAFKYFYKNVLLFYS